MSAFVVSEAVIDDVVCLLMPSAMDGDEIATLMGSELWAMNIDAVEQRYGDEMTLCRNLLPTYRYVKPKAVLKIQRYNSLRCFTYQCSEGNVPERDLFKRCERLEVELDDIFLDKIDNANVQWNRERDPADEARAAE